MKNTSFILTTFILGASATFAQNVGISEAAPNSKLDVVQTEATGNSIEISHNIAGNGSSALWVKNSGLGRAVNAGNLNAATTQPVGEFFQSGTAATAHGIYNVMDAATTGIGNFVDVDGTGIANYSRINNAANADATYYADNSGSGYGLMSFQVGTGGGIYNDVAAGLGTFNVIRSNSLGTINLLNFAGGTGSISDLGTQDGTGYFMVGVDNVVTPTAGGDVWAFDATIRTATPTGAFVNGGGFYTGQSGVGHGILINHSGTAGRNAEFNIQNAANVDPGIFVAHNGQGSAIQGQNQNNTIAGTISVADFSYTGTDVADHIGVEGFSSPAAGWGIGVEGTGGWFGVFANGDIGATGAKPFTIDHPQDPENKILKHFAIESNEVLNMYRGIVELDANGEATVQLPEYFEVINKDFSYQLTAIGTPQQPYVLTEIEGNEFKVAGAPNTKVSWTVYADRNDPYMQAYPEKGMDVVEKTGDRQGKYLTPELYGEPATKGMFYSPTHQSSQMSKKAPSGVTQEQLEELRNKAAEATPATPQVNGHKEQ